MSKRIITFFLVLAMFFISMWITNAASSWYRLKLELHFLDEKWNVPQWIIWNDIAYFSVSVNWKRWASPIAKWKIWKDWVVVFNMKNKIVPTTTWKIYFVSNVRAKKMESFLISLDDDNIKDEEKIWVNWIDYVLWNATAILKQKWSNYEFSRFLKKKVVNNSWNEIEIVKEDVTYNFEVTNTKLLPRVLKIEDLNWNEIIWQVTLKDTDPSFELVISNLRLKTWSFYNIRFKPIWSIYKERWLTFNFSSNAELQDILWKFDYNTAVLKPNATADWIFPYVRTIALLLLLFLIYYVFKKKRIELSFLEKNFWWKWLFFKPNSKWTQVSK